jgi:LmbE family N-acetylglucosaminyl deacetylase
VNVLFAPHNDDETLFAAYTVMHHNCHVITCLRSFVQESRGGPRWTTREAETLHALRALVTERWTQWHVRDDHDEAAMEGQLRGEMLALAKTVEVTRVWAPAIEAGGHWHHNLIGELAEEVFGPERTSFYMTYIRDNGRSKGVEVVPTADMIRSKLAALACYRSQIELDNTRPWFLDDVMREWRPE